MKIPVIVGFGGINSAGRSSSHHAYKRTVMESLPASEKQKTLLSLASMMNLMRWNGDSWYDVNGQKTTPELELPKLEQDILDGTLIRKIHSSRFSAENFPVNVPLKISPPEQADNKTLRVSFSNAESNNNRFQVWDKVESEKENQIIYESSKNLALLVKSSKDFEIKAAGQIPLGFEPGKLYRSNNHPRGIIYSIYGMSDALNSLGIEWSALSKSLPADRIGVYASSSMGQLDEFSGGGFLRAWHNGKRPNSKQLPFSFPEMVADFINSYVIGNAGHTHGIVGACATMLYNLYSAAEDIRLGKRDIAVVGCGEAPVNPEVIAGYHAMGALADEAGLASLDKVSTEKINHRRACRPFSANCGFVVGESAQFLILASEEIALERGCQILGAVGGVHIAADSFKHSISKPGLGNFLSFFKCMGIAESIIGSDALKNETFVQSHGTGTPQNRITESQIISKAAEVFGIEDWKVCAIKSYLGHPLGTAGGDQIGSTLGIWRHGLIPGIKTIDHIADDVHQKHLKFLMKDEEIDPAQSKAAFINAKGFGGNNATAVILSPTETMDLIKKRHGRDKLKQHDTRLQKTKQKIEADEDKNLKGLLEPLYRSSEEFAEFDKIKMDRNKLSIDEKGIYISVKTANPFE